MLSKEEQRKLEIYKVSSLTYPVLEKKHATGIIILAADSFLPSKSEIDVNLYGDSFHCSVPPTTVNNNVIEFEIPWNSKPLSICQKVTVSVHDKKTDITTVGTVLQVKANKKNSTYTEILFEEISRIFISSTDRLIKKLFKNIKNTKSPEGGVRSVIELDDLSPCIYDEFISYFKDQTNPPG